jgi:hypothetical protein
VLSRYVLDKVLHDPYTFTDDMMADKRFKYIFLLRRPEEALQSIIYMKNGFSSVMGNDSYIFPECKYYQSRLREMINMARKCDTNAVFIDSVDILENTALVLERLTSWLDLTPPLTDKYEIFYHTGKPGLGDPSERIKSGKVDPSIKEGKGIDIPSDVLDECNQHYQQCRKILTGLNRISF